jgi:glyoxylase-like metal-dependent hydrolase (beta-lactamase superfamily II)
MREIAPGVYHWTAMHANIHSEVSSYFVADSATLLDPMVPPGEGLDWFRDDREPRAIALTNRHHHRDAERFCEAFGLGPVLVPEPGLHEFTDKDLPVVGYGPGEEIVPGIVAHEVDALSPDEMALEIRSVGALAVADSLTHDDGVLSFVRDDYMDDPAETKRALTRSFASLLAIDFDTLLFAHGAPLVGGAKRALRDFVASASTG